jgi:tetratricopeptide (TPR) repeat protein
VHPLDDSLDTVRQTPAFGDPNARWRALNDTGVSLALEGRWPEALEAFSAALQGAPAFADAPDVHALLHGNRAQAHFHCDEVQAAVESAYRSLAARLVCGDTSDAPVARMRADLGVYLAACGETANAEESLRKALASLEARFGEHDARLATLLENQARFQLMTQHPDAAEPILLRLHALMDASAMEASQLTPLFDAVRNARTPEAPAADDMDVFPRPTDRAPVPESVSLLDDAFELLDGDAA